jgi:hypothetical protein
LLQACQTGGANTAQGGKCGDGICDDIEQQNRQLCPIDCMSEPLGDSDDDNDDQGGGTGKCESGKWTLEIEGCGTMTNTEPFGESCISYKSCITLDQSCRVQGTGTGTHTKCEYTGACSYEVECPDFNMSVSGVVELGENGQENFKITVDSSGATVTGKATCAGVPVPFSGGSILQDAFGSAVRNGEGYLFEKEVNREADVRATIEGKDAFMPNNLSYKFNAYLSPGCD